MWPLHPYLASYVVMVGLNGLGGAEAQLGEQGVRVQDQSANIRNKFLHFDPGDA